MPVVVDAPLAAHMVGMNQIIDQLIAYETGLFLFFSPLIALACFMVYDIIREDNENDKREKEHRKYREAREAASGEARPDQPLDDKSI